MKKRTKAFFSAAVSVVLVITVGFSMITYGRDISGIVTYNGYALRYSSADNNTGVTVTGFIGTLPSDFSIPEQMDGYTVTKIGDEAFSPNSSGTAIETLTIPSSVTEIGMVAFANSAKLHTVIFGEGVTSIGMGAFMMCGQLASVHLPAAVKTVEGAFFGSGITEMTVDVNNPFLAAVDNTLFSKDMKILYQFPIGLTAVTAYSMPKTVTEIAYGAFGLSGLTSVQCSPVLEQIAEEAFTSSAITVLNLPASLRQIGAYAFFDCKSLRGVAIVSSEVAFGSRVFFGCDNVVVRGVKGSSVEDFAKNNNLNFDRLTVDMFVFNEAYTAAFIQSQYSDSAVLLTDKDSVLLSGDSLVGTGADLTVVDSDGLLRIKSVIAVTGDIDGDGLQNNADYELMKNIAVGAQQLHSGSVFMTVADLEQDGVIDAFDVAAYDLYLFNLTK